jgi:Tfp pilus assembly protein PilF
LNVEVYPKSANVYDSLGEAYWKKGQEDQAIKNYKKALEIDPEMESAQNALTQLGGSQ